MEKFATTIYGVELNDMERNTLGNASRILYNLCLEMGDIKVLNVGTEKVNKITNEDLNIMAENLKALKESYFIEEVADNWEQQDEIE